MSAEQVGHSLNWWGHLSFMTVDAQGHPVSGTAGYSNWGLIQKPILLTSVHIGLVFSHWTSYLNCSTFILVEEIRYTNTEVIIWEKWDKHCKKGVSSALWNRELLGMQFRQDLSSSSKQIIVAAIECLLSQVFYLHLVIHLKNIYCTPTMHLAPF